MAEATEPATAQCPDCGSADIEAATTIDLAFGEEIPCLKCVTCGHIIDWAPGYS